MIYATYIDIAKIINELSSGELTTRTMIACYSIVEHEISDLGYSIATHTKDIRQNPDVGIPVTIKEGLRIVVQTALSGIPADKRVKLSIFKTAKYFIITVV